MGKDTTEKVSIIILTFNRKNDLRKCFEAIYRQDYRNFEQKREKLPLFLQLQLIHLSCSQKFF